MGLLSNAVKYSDKATNVDVKLELISSDNMTIKGCDSNDSSDSDIKTSTNTSKVRRKSITTLTGATLIWSEDQAPNSSRFTIKNSSKAIGIGYISHNNNEFSSRVHNYEVCEPVYLETTRRSLSVENLSPSSKKIISNRFPNEMGSSKKQSERVVNVLPKIQIRPLIKTMSLKITYTNNKRIYPIFSAVELSAIIAFKKSNPVPS